MRKGFTLIELLAVIAILAIILLISVPKVLDVIEESRVNGYKADEKMLSKAAATYLGNNVDLLPENIGDKVEISLSDLKTDELISEIKDCNGYVLITKTEDGYSYNPELKCGDANTIGSSADDGLVLHYTFDDKKESTVNLINDVSGNSNTGYTGFSFDCVVDEESPVGTAVKATVLEDPVNTAGRTRFPSTAQDATWYYVSIYVKKDPSVLVDVEPRVYTGHDWYYMKALDDEGDNFIKDHYRRFGAYVLTGISSGGPSPAFGAFTYDTNIGDVFYFAAPQLEAKDHVTDFVDGTRNDFVRDYSLSGLNMNLENNNIKWSYDRDRQSGVYEFDGSASFSLADNAILDLNDNFSVVAEIKLGIVEWAGIVHKGNSTIQGAGVAYGFNSNGFSFISWNGSNTPYAGRYATDSNQWHHLVGVVDSGVRKLYVDGKYISSSSIGNSSWNNDNDLYIGSSGNPSSYYKGKIDDVRVYNRVLTEEEIKYMYYVEK